MAKYANVKPKETLKVKVPNGVVTIEVDEHGRVSVKTSASMGHLVYVDKEGMHIDRNVFGPSYPCSVSSNPTATT